MSQNDVIIKRNDMYIVVVEVSIISVHAAMHTGHISMLLYIAAR